jgi:hypothetical protein
MYQWQKFADDPAISWGVIALIVFSVLAPTGPYLVVQNMYKVSGQ